MQKSKHGFSRIMGLIAAAMIGGGAYETGRTTLRSMGLATERGAPSSSNGGRGRPGNAHHKRMAVKARNVRRHRVTLKGTK